MNLELKKLPVNSEINISGLKLEKIGLQEITLVSPSGEKTTLKDSRVILAKDDETLYISTNRRNKPHLKALIGTWKSIVAKAKDDKEHVLKITASFKHFPISMTVSPKEVKVLNFLGGKKSSGEPAALGIRIPECVKVQAIDPRTILLKSRNYIKLGNTAEQFRKIRYRSHLKNMDSRVFCDGFIIDKER